MIKTLVFGQTLIKLFGGIIMSSKSKLLVCFSIQSLLLFSFVVQVFSQDILKRHDNNNQFLNYANQSSQQTGQMELRKPGLMKKTGQINPNRVFVIPTGDVLNSLEVSISGGSIIGEMNEEKRPFLGRISLGLGDIAEIEASTAGIISGLKDGSPILPTVGLKLKLLSEQPSFPYIGLAAALQSSPQWHNELRDSLVYQKRLATLYLVGTKKINNIGLHLGVSVNDLRIRIIDELTDEVISPQDEEKKFVNKNIVTPFVGLTYRVNSRTFIMAEWEMIPNYDIQEETQIVEPDNIKTTWMTVAGVRFFAMDWLPIDVGVLYRDDYYGIADTRIQANFNFIFSIPELLK